MSKILDIDFRTGSLREKVNNVLPTITGSNGIKKYNKGLAHNVVTNSDVKDYGVILDYGTSDFTIVLNVYIGLDTVTGSIFGNGYFPGLSLSYNELHSRVDWYFNSGSIVYSILNINKGKEYSIILKRDSNVYSYSLNGSSFSVLITQIDNLTSPLPFKIGRTAGFVGAVGINIYSLTIDNTAYTQEQANQEYKNFLNSRPLSAKKQNFNYSRLKPTDLSNEEGLVAAYNMQPQNGVLVDISGNGSNQVIFSGNPLSTKNGTAFNGVSDSTKGVVAAVTDWTLSMRVKPRDLNTVLSYILGMNTNTGVFLGGTYSPISLKWGMFSNGIIILGNSILNENVEYTLNIAKEGTNYSLYVNGLFEVTRVEGSFTLSNIWIGAREGTFGFSDAIVKDFRIHNKALTLQQIQAYHNQYANQLTFKDNFKYDKADGTNITPKGWIKGS